MDRPNPVWVTGPLEPYASGFWRELASQGYAVTTATAQLYLMGHLSRWLASAGLGPDDLSPERVARYLRDRRASGQVRRLTPRGLRPLLGHLRASGALPEPTAATPADAQGRLLDAFGAYLSGRRGLAGRTIAWDRHVARRFLTWCSWEPAGDGGRSSTLTADAVRAFLLAEHGRRGAGSMANLVTALRAFLGYLTVEGHIATPLDAAVPAAARRRGNGASRALDQVDVARLLASCDRRAVAGRRDHAILTLLARLGLRAGEVAALRIEDVDWRGGQLLVTGKGGRRDRLPLPSDVGRALAEYCAGGRPRGGSRSLFLQVRAPYTGLSSTAVSHVVVRACDRAGMPRVRAHRLRHTAATAMRRAGAPLFEIGQVLRHRYVATTARYAREDTVALAAVARAWPGGAR